MRIRSLIVAALLASCVHDHPVDPRQHNLEEFARSGLGAWVKVEVSESALEGELISIDHAHLRVYSASLGKLWVFSQSNVESVEVYPIVDVDGPVATRVLGGLATITHGFWILLTLPFYLGTTAAMINGDLDPVVTYPQDPWTAMQKWARFPQGLPAGVGLDELRHQHRTPTPVATPPVPVVDPVVPVEVPPVPVEPALVEPPAP